jgi:hypothetical protein
VQFSDELDFDLHKPGRPASAAMERHYRPDELSAAWSLSVKVILEIFSAESGVLRIDRPERLHKRGYCTMRFQFRFATPEEIPRVHGVPPRQRIERGDHMIGQDYHQLRSGLRGSCGKRLPLIRSRETLSASLIRRPVHRISSIKARSSAP